MRRLRRHPAAILAVAGALTVLIGASTLLLFAAGGSSANPLKIQVFAKQYLWSFGYPSEGNAFSKSAFHTPVGRPVTFEMHSEDVLHAFWVPDWNVKVDTVPGDIEEVEVTPETTGVYRLICAQSCGLLHNAMRAKIIVEEPAQFERWVNTLSPVPARLQKQAQLDRELRSIRKSIADDASN